jgi:hypothetical protein
MLAGARLRNSERTGIELVLQNPSGGRGVYILRWPGVQALCSPTLHDTVLFRRLTSLAVIDQRFSIRMSRVLSWFGHDLSPKCHILWIC